VIAARQIPIVTSEEEGDSKAPKCVAKRERVANGHPGNHHSAPPRRALSRVRPMTAHRERRLAAERASAVHPRGPARYLKYCGRISLSRGTAVRTASRVTLIGHERDLSGPACAERTDVITRGDNRSAGGGIRGREKGVRARRAADTINKTSTRQRARDPRGL